MKNIVKKFWNSPTFTTWGAKLVQPLRLLLVTPLILTRFTLDEQAAWFLFAAIGVFGQIVNSRLNLTFARMISLANGGATDLSPIKGRAQQANDAIRRPPNWDGIIRVYNCLFFLVGLTVLLIFTINTAVGYISLKNICDSLKDEQVKNIWLSFTLMRIGDLVANLASPPSIAIRGLNHVALVNRWTILFSLLSVVSGYIVLLNDGGIVALAAVMQAMIVLRCIRGFWLTKTVNEGRLWKSFRPHWDQEVFRWAREPLWKGFIGEFSKSGVLQLTGIIFSFYGSTAALASYLFSFSIARTIQNFAMAPFSSQTPKFSKMMAQQRYAELAELFKNRVAASQLILVLGFLGLAIVGPDLLSLIGSENSLLPTAQWLCLGVFFLYDRFNGYCFMLCASANNIKMYWDQAFVGFCTVVILFVAIPKLGVWGILIALAIPSILIMNQRPYLMYKQQIRQSVS